MDGISQVLKDETGIDTYVAEQPLDCVALGTGKALIDLNNCVPVLLLVTVVCKC